MIFKGFVNVKNNREQHGLLKKELRQQPCFYRWELYLSNSPWTFYSAPIHCQERDLGTSYLALFLPKKSFVCFIKSLYLCHFPFLNCDYKHESVSLLSQEQETTSSGGGSHSWGMLIQSVRAIASFISLLGRQSGNQKSLLLFLSKLGSSGNGSYWRI